MIEQKILDFNLNINYGNENFFVSKSNINAYNLLLKKNNSIVVGYACIVDRSDKNVLIKDKILSQIKFEIKTFKEDQLPEGLNKIQPTKPGSKDLSK